MGRKRNEEERTRLYKTAVALFADRGYKATKIQDIAAAAGVEKTQVQHYFPKKDLFISRLLEEILDEIVKVADESGLHSENPFVMLYYVGYAHLDFLVHDDSMKLISKDIFEERTLTTDFIETEIKWVAEQFPGAGKEKEQIATAIRMTMGGLYEQLNYLLGEGKEIDTEYLVSTSIRVVTMLNGMDPSATEEVLNSVNFSQQVSEALCARMHEHIFG